MCPKTNVPFCNIQEAGDKLSYSFTHRDYYCCINLYIYLIDKVQFNVVWLETTLYQVLNSNAVVDFCLLSNRQIPSSTVCIMMTYCKSNNTHTHFHSALLITAHIPRGPSVPDFGRRGRSADSASLSFAISPLLTLCPPITLPPYLSPTHKPITLDSQ